MEQKKYITKNFDYAFGQHSGVIDLNKDKYELPRFPINEKYGDLERFKFNTSISTLMEYTNSLSKIWSAGCNNDLWKESIIILIKLLSPMAPHITEELWELNGQEFSVHNQEFPSWDDQLISTDTKTIVVQVNGKVRSQFDIEGTKSEEEIFQIASNNEKVQENLTGKEIIKKIYVKDKLVNFVVK